MQELSTVQNGSMDAAQSLANVVLEAGHKITLLNLEMVRNAMSQAAASCSASLLQESRAGVPCQSLVKDTATYFRSLSHISAETQVEIARMLQAHMSEFGKNAISLLDRASKSETGVAAAMAAAAMRSALATATASCESLTETTRRVTEMAQANANALAETVQSMGTEQPEAAKDLKKAA